MDALGLDNLARTLRRDRIYFADRPEDEALMATYPVVTQAEVADPDAAPKSKRRKGRVRKPTKGAEETPGRKSFAEKAADEFA